MTNEWRFIDEREQSLAVDWIEVGHRVRNLIPTRIAIPFAACAALLGCATPNSVTYAVINAPPRAFARRDPTTVDIFVGKTPARPFVEVGLFEVYAGWQSDGTDRTTEDLLGTLRLHAGLRGCDAVQVLGVELTGKTSWRIVRGVCDMYTDAQAEQTAGQGAVFARLPGEGSSCAPRETGMTVAPTHCPDPLICSNKVCVSPYR